eukprot:2132177-Prymnesium_polylepis.1
MITRHVGLLSDPLREDCVVFRSFGLRFFFVDLPPHGHAMVCAVGGRRVSRLRAGSGAPGTGWSAKRRARQGLSPMGPSRKWRLPWAAAACSWWRLPSEGF